MHRFFVSPSGIDRNTVTITGPDVNHIRNVLRMKEGDELTVSDGEGTLEYRCAIRSVETDRVFCEVLFTAETGHELPARVFLFQGLPKSDKLEQIIQKNVELGVYRIIPVSMQRSVVKLDAKKAAQKTQRWNGIAEAAAKQSRRGIIPEVIEPMSFKKAVLYAKEHCETRLLPYELEGEVSGMEQTRRLLEKIPPNGNIAVFIGPEGGFDPAEVAEAENAGFRRITLGKRILRTETAGLCVMSILMYLLEP
ncbi:MAG: 16S rRNA (uracil(1498)-N(3))-methyltransferase [Lachnospiraceae bacterium]|nr:16S rRNA (uracil(1498)-N(3))-methyltransferase [Lachnospiraceae bacterium]